MYVVEKHANVYTLMCDGNCVKGDMSSREEADRWRKIYENRDALCARKPAMAEKLAKWKEHQHNQKMARSANRSRRANKK